MIPVKVFRGFSQKTKTIFDLSQGELGSFHILLPGVSFPIRAILLILPLISKQCSPQDQRLLSRPSLLKKEGAA